MSELSIDIPPKENILTKAIKFLFSDKRMAWFWFIVRIYVGWQWFIAGWEKVQSSVWVGSKAGTMLSTFVQDALIKAVGAHADVQPWYAWFLQTVVLPHATLWSYMVSYGEVLVGIGLILGAFTGLSAFFGAFMNLNYLLAGTVSINPVLYTLSIAILLAWKIAGYYGVDRVVEISLKKWREMYQ